MNDAPTFVVGIGASAGGLEALTEFFSQLPDDTGMTFLVVMHFDPTHESLSSRLLSPTTRMPVREAEGGEPIVANHVYIIPPDRTMRYREGRIELTPLEGPRQRVVDILFQSLADSLGDRVVSVILSGSGTDGSKGIRAVWEAGGVTFVQEPSSARFNGMPDSAIATGCVADILAPGDLAKALGSLAASPSGDAAVVSEDSTDDSWLGRLFAMLRQQKQVDFSQYKYPTLVRRVQRRMKLLRLETPQAYVEHCANHPEEIDHLFSDFLITVTRFFRDPELFDELGRAVLLPLIRNKEADAPIRIWSVGCSSGEEVYSLAMELAEYLGDDYGQFPIQIFGTDVDEDALRTARSGQYPRSIEREVSQQRLARFFRKTAVGYQVVKSLRDVCVFSRHDIIKDPPFARLDLVVCRNLLIYFSLPLQEHVFATFHYALRPGGVLWLGKSESLGGQRASAWFKTMDGANVFYVRSEGKAPLRTHRFGKSFTPRRLPEATAQPLRQETNQRRTSMQGEVERVMLDQFSPPSVVINEQYDILYYHGKVEPFLQMPRGPATNNLLRLARPEYVAGLRQAVESVKNGQTPSEEYCYTGLDEPESRFRIVVRPLEGDSGEARRFLLVFTAVERIITVNKGDAGDTEIPTQWLAELQSARAYQQQLIVEYTQAQEELLVANEDLQAANEELQSTIEELETTSEELQSTSQELSILYDEVQGRNQQLSQLNSDLINLIETVDIPLLMIDQNSIIRRFTPTMTRLINLKPTDTGRPLTDLSGRLDVASLEQWVQKTIQSLEPFEKDIQDTYGRWFRLRIRPYRTDDNRIDGAVIALFDIHELKSLLAEADEAERSKDAFLATLSHEIRTPLTSIISWAEMLRTGRLDAATSERAVESILGSAETQARLIEGLLDVTRIISGNIVLEQERLDPADLADEVFQSLRFAAEGAGVELHSGPHDGAVCGDRIRLRQILSNLVTNAIKFSLPQTTVSVSSRVIREQDGVWCEISVADQGQGISTADQRHIFDRFRQADGTSTRSRGGVGLGLSIVKGLTELHGGTVDLESPGKGRGSVFRVRLPALREVEAEVPAVVRKDDDSRLSDELDLQGTDILLVEDDAATREVLVALLEFYGGQVRAVMSASEGYEALTSMQPTVLLSDIGLPGEDGFSLMRRVRAEEEEHGGYTAAIALTAYASHETTHAAAAAGFDLHLPKPVESKHLVQSIMQLTDRTVKAPGSSS